MYAYALNNFEEEMLQCTDFSQMDRKLLLEDLEFCSAMCPSAAQLTSQDVVRRAELQDEDEHHCGDFTGPCHDLSLPAPSSVPNSSITQ